MLNAAFTSRTFACLLAGLAVAWPSGAGAEETKAQALGFYEKFAMDPAMSSAAVSPNGKTLATIQRFSKDGPNHLLIYEVADLAAKPVILSADPMMIESFFWANNDRLVVSFRQEVDMLQDLDIDTRQVFRIASVDKAGKKWVPLPQRRVDRRSANAKWMRNLTGAAVLARMPRDEDHLLMLYDDDQDGIADLFRVNVTNGRPQMVYRNGSRVQLAEVDADGEPRLAFRYDAGRETLLHLARRKGEKEWLEIGKTVAHVGAVSEAFNALGFFNEKDPNEIWVTSNHDADTVGIFAFDIGSGKFKELLFRHPKYDAVGVRTKYVEGEGDVPLAFNHHGRGIEHYVFDDEEKALQDAIDAILPRTHNDIASRSRDDSVVVVSSVGPQQPRTWYLLRDKTRIDELGMSMPFLTEDMLSPVQWIHYEARDGRTIPALLTVPEGKGPFPTVVHPHGGPIARDYWGFSLWPQLLASRGYLVIQPQFRISTGFGREHLEAGFAQWGLALQDDLDDAAQHLVEQKLADPNRLAIFGWSYGGYASFVGAARDPNPYQCAIAGAGVADLPYFRAWLADNGDFSEKTYRPTIEGLNALEMAKSVDVPILVIHGDLDERVPVAESRKFVAELKKHGKHHKYIELEGANHFFGTIFYRHWMEMFPAMIDWLDSTCGLKKPSGGGLDAQADGGQLQTHDGGALTVAAS